jgi:hypothetical protein
MIPDGKVGGSSLVYPLVVLAMCYLETIDSLALRNTRPCWRLSHKAALPHLSQDDGLRFMFAIP